MGHRAKYAITRSDLVSYLDARWLELGKSSAIPRGELDDGKTVSFDRIAHNFDGLGWPVLKSVVQFHSPVQADGGGATYYFDASSNTAYHRAGYW